jgi:hypothetical protein
MDLSRIEPRFIKENHYLGMGFPKQCYLFFMVTGVEPMYFEYDVI